MGTPIDEMGLVSHDTARSNGKDGSQHPVTGDRAVVNVFFDGTSNNIFNTDAMQDPAAKRNLEGKGFAGKDTSYANAATSTALMWKGIKTIKTSNPVYIDGIGTTRYQSDSTAGYGMGQGDTGIETRAQSAFAAIDEALKENRKTELPTLLDINVYGFSRGAATARHFIYLVNKDKAKKKREFHPTKWGKMKLQINFVGLFDTVSSFGYDGDFDDDVSQLHLRFEEDFAQKVFHLIAGDEYRKNFSATTIASAGGIGHEITIPGAHSDVGGSYNVIEDETRILDDQKVREFVYEQGWYSTSDKQTYRTRGQTADHYVHRRQVLAEYSKVAHSVMADAANAALQKEVFKDPKPPLDLDVLEIQTKLRAFAKDKKNTRWDLNKEMPARAKAIRRKLFHVSFSDSTGMSPRLGGDGKPHRQIIAG
jgi:Uncharacterized alpha/beta hydrolase domain (DUF2235)